MDQSPDFMRTLVIYENRFLDFDRPIIYLSLRTPSYHFPHLEISTCQYVMSKHGKTWCGVVGHHKESAPVLFPSNFENQLL
jgi:hypothetical protein